MNIINVYKITKKEIRFNIENYWFFLSALIIVLTNFIIIYFGETISGDYSQTDTRSLTLSLIHLQMYLIPLLSFILSYDSILSEKESGVLDLILSYRISLIDIIFGKLCGNSIIFSLSFLLGFLPIGIYLIIIGIKIQIILKFVLTSIWLNIIFNSFAIYISDISKDRTFVIMLSIFIWLFFIFIYDVLFTFLVIMTYGNLSSQILKILLFFNPAELFRLSSIFYFMPNDMNELFGINIENSNIIYIILPMIVWLIFIFFFYKNIYKK